MHFTYHEPKEDLCQGDVLRRTDALNALLKPVHPYYLNEDYKLFMILTQTCDLVRRDGGQCSARYITVASVRPMEIAVQRYLRTHQGEFEMRAGVCSDRSRERLVQFVKHLLNNNEKEYFYLRQQSDCGIEVDMCALLRESFPLQARQHYQSLLDARVASLTPMFQAKLGWLVGNIFSRVGTDDWVPTVVDTQGFDEVVNGIVDGACAWIDDRKLRQAKKSIPAGGAAAMTDVQIQDLIGTAKASSRRSEVIERVCRVLEEKYPAQFGGLRNIRQTLASDTELKVFLGS